MEERIMTMNDFIKQMKMSQAPLKAMVEMIPEDKVDWAPDNGFMTMGQLIKHLAENWIIIKMMVTNDWPMPPEQVTEAMKLENLTAYSKTEALAGMEKDLNGAVAYLENEISEEDFFNKEVTAPWGFNGKIWEAVLMGKNHLAHHKMQLHLYLKLLGLPVNTGTLYGM